MYIQEFIDKYQGISHDKINCYELVQLFYKEILNISLPSQGISHNQYSKIQAKIIQESQSSKWYKIYEPEKYCILAFKEHPLFINHIGICLENGRFLHSTLHRGVSVERLTDNNYKSRLKACYKYNP